MSFSKYAFFDVDGTLITIKSMFSFLNYISGEGSHLLDGTRHIDSTQLESFMNLAQSAATRETVNRAYYQLFTGISYKQFLVVCEHWAAQQLSLLNDMLIHDVVTELNKEKANQAGIVLVSGSFKEILTPLLESLGIDEILATQLALTSNGYLTGEIKAPQTIGSGKAVAMTQFLVQKNVSPAVCTAYGDDRSDEPMLSLVGSPTAIIGDHVLSNIAQSQNWTMLHVEEQKAYA